MLKLCIESYEKAIERLQRLTIEEFAFTTECDEPRKKAEVCNKIFAKKAREKQAKMRKIMAVPTLQGKKSKCQSLLLISKCIF